MSSIFAVTLPFFALVLCGYLAARRGVLPESAIPGLNGYVLYFALPCMLFRFGSETPLFDLLNPVVLAVYVAAALLIVFFTIAVTMNERVGLKDAAFGALVAAFPNTGFMGVPLLVALLGSAAAGPVISSILADFFITSTLCLALAQAAGAAGAAAAGGAADAASASARQAALRALRAALGNPLPWSIALGAVFSVAGLTLPGPAAKVVEMLAASASPVALFTIGVVLWRSSQHAHTRTPVTDYLPVALIKLFVHPLLVFLLGGAALALGAPLTKFQLVVLTLAAALPSASNVSLLTERYGADSGRVARIIMSSTVLAFGSFSALAWLFGVNPA
ncbi:transporter [beta proteobacterium AAP121]|nr:transporter [beta proteobacterium AAP65]KPF99294.1 transporter [beta proteobacterium AAP121]